MAPFGDQAMHALIQNDADALVAAFKGQNVNTAVNSSGTFGGSASIDQRLAWAEGDTMLHLAMRNQKWLCRQACVQQLNVDPRLKNSSGVTPPQMQLESSAKRVTVFGSGWLALHFDWVDFGFGSLPYLLVSIACLPVLFDALLACRWYFLATYHYSNDALRVKRTADGTKDKRSTTSKKKGFVE